MSFALPSGYHTGEWPMLHFGLQECVWLQSQDDKSWWHKNGKNLQLRMLQLSTDELLWHLNLKAERAQQLDLFLSKPWGSQCLSWGFQVFPAYRVSWNPTDIKAICYQRLTSQLVFLLFPGKVQHDFFKKYSNWQVILTWFLSFAAIK